MPETILVGHLGEGAREHRDAELGTILVLRRLGGRTGGAIRRTDRGRAWRRVTVDTVSVSGGGPYQDTVTTYEVAFEGGAPSATSGWEMPHATFPPLGPLPPGSVSFPPHEVVAERHAERVRLKAQPLLEWEHDSTSGDPSPMGATRLRSWAHVGGDSWRTVYRAVVVKPNMS